MSKTEIVLNKSDAVVGKVGVGVLDDNELASISGGVSHTDAIEASIWGVDAVVADTGKGRKIDSDSGIRRIDR